MTRRSKEAIHGFLYILPSLLMLLVIAVYPLIMTGYYSLTSYNMLQAPKWIGFENFIRLWKDPYVSASLRNTTLFTLITVPLQSIFALLLANVLAIHFRKRFGRLVRSALFVPVIASTILVGTLWAYLLSPVGLLNQGLKSLGLGTPNWLGSKSLALLSVGLVSIWKHVGYFLVIFFAALMDIPASLYEAAKVDGAGPVQTFFRITLPSLKPVCYLVVTLGIIWSFQVFDLVYTMTGGGPGHSTQTLVLTIYISAFKEYNMGYASALALLMLAFVLLINALQRLLWGKEDKS